MSAKENNTFFAIIKICAILVSALSLVVAVIAVAVSLLALTILAADNQSEAQTDLKRALVVASVALALTIASLVAVVKELKVIVAGVALAALGGALYRLYAQQWVGAGVELAIAALSAEYASLLWQKSRREGKERHKRRQQTTETGFQ